MGTLQSMFFCCLLFVMGGSCVSFRERLKVRLALSWQLNERTLLSLVASKRTDDWFVICKASHGVFVECLANSN